jgi:hypothetical protein
VYVGAKSRRIFQKKESPGVAKAIHVGRFTIHASLNEPHGMKAPACERGSDV